jgi:aquaporin rerated protein, other eukaryote
MNSAVAQPEPLRASFAIPKSDGPLVRPRGIPGLGWLHDGPRGHVVAVIGEFCGTFSFLFFAFAGTQVANMSSIATQATGPEPSVLLFIALAFGFSLAVNVWVFFRISGGLFNPAVSLDARDH